MTQLKLIRAGAGEETGSGNAYLTQAKTNLLKFRLFSVFL